MEQEAAAEGVAALAGEAAVAVGGSSLDSLVVAVVAAAAVAAEMPAQVEEEQAIQIAPDQD